MRLSKKSEYALLSLIELARKYDSEELLSVKKLSEKYSISQKFLEAILADLHAKHIVKVSRGRNGGYMLAKKPSEISIAEIVRMIDGAIAPVHAVSTFFYDKSPIEQEKKALKLFKEVRDQAARTLEKTTLADLT